MKYTLLGLLVIVCVVTQHKANAAPQLHASENEDVNNVEEHVPYKREISGKFQLPPDHKVIRLKRNARNLADCVTPGVAAAAAKGAVRGSPGGTVGAVGGAIDGGYTECMRSGK